MKRSERINSMLIYLNDKTYFNLKDVMSKYNISKSTALRDIQSLEALGMPIYSEPGRYGRYGILKNKLLSPIIFTVDEMYALYFAMLTLDSYQSTPFHLRLRELKEKFQRSISQENIHRLRRMEAVLQFENTQHINASPLLREIVEAAVDQVVCEIVYMQNGRETTARVQFQYINSRFGQWYASGFQIETKALKIYRCDRIKVLKRCDGYPSLDREAIDRHIAAANRKENVTVFQVEVTNKGADIFYKENYPSMTLEEDRGRFFIKGTYKDSEEQFIARYFLNFGDSIIKISPMKLHQSIENMLAALREHYLRITSDPKCRA